MAYTPTEWKNGDVITAEKLNKLEEGVHTANGRFFIIRTTDAYWNEDDLEWSKIDKTFEEISDAYNNGYVPILYVSIDTAVYEVYHFSSFIPSLNIDFIRTEYTHTYRVSIHPNNQISKYAE